MKVKGRVLAGATGVALVCFLALSIAPCSWLEPLDILHAPWRHECQKLAPCWGRGCNILPRTTWKSQDELDIQENVSTYKSRAELGDVSAQRALGGYYRNPYLGAQDDLEAIKWWRMAADQGDADAEGNLGLRYLYLHGAYIPTGHGINIVKGDASSMEDYAEALRWLHKAAEHGEGESIYMLTIYGNDPEDVYFWRAIDSCIRVGRRPAHVVVSGVEVEKSCPRIFAEGSELPLTPARKLTIEKRAREWLTKHQIKTPTPLSDTTF